nr:nucleoid-associated protein [Chryseobacterium cucumeris]
MKIIVHKIGNKILAEGMELSDELLQLDETQSDLMHDFFLGSFKSEETYHFYSDTYLINNPIYKAVKGLFAPGADLIYWSKNIARILYDTAEHPRIQGGELFVAFFPSQNENDVDKIGIFKTEKRESFLKVFPNDTDPIEVDKGISLAKIDKAALIYDKDKENGYVLSVVDNNKNGDMYYWFEDFLKVKQRTDDYFHTQESLAVFKDYIKKQLPAEFEVSKADQADFLNKSLKFFKEKEEFKMEEFLNEVLADEQVIESFSNFKTDYEQDMQINIAEEFPISESAVKKSQKHFKSIIKLDKNFHIYVHGDKTKLHQGQDENGLFYKVYYEKES